MSKLTALEVQQMLGVADYENIAHGYTYNRDTLDIYFQDGKIVRQVSDVDGILLYENISCVFEIDFFTTDVKRWYKNRTNSKLIQLFETFNGPFNGV